MKEKQSTGNFDKAEGHVVELQTNEPSANTSLTIAEEVKEVDTQDVNEEAVVDFSVGEKVLAYESGMLYDAKILQKAPSEEGEGFAFFIHYQGWRDRFNEWVLPSRLLPLNPKNVALHLKLQHDKKEREREEKEREKERKEREKEKKGNSVLSEKRERLGREIDSEKERLAAMIAIGKNTPTTGKRKAHSSTNAASESEEEKALRMRIKMLEKQMYAHSDVQDGDTEEENEHSDDEKTQCNSNEKNHGKEKDSENDAMDIEPTNTDNDDRTVKNRQKGGKAIKIAVKTPPQKTAKDTKKSLQSKDDREKGHDVDSEPETAEVKETQEDSGAKTSSTPLKTTKKRKTDEQTSNTHQQDVAQSTTTHNAHQNHSASATLPNITVSSSSSSSKYTSLPSSSSSSVSSPPALISSHSHNTGTTANNSAVTYQPFSIHSFQPIAPPSGSSGLQSQSPSTSMSRRDVDRDVLYEQLVVRHERLKRRFNFQVHENWDLCDQLRIARTRVHRQQHEIRYLIERVLDLECDHFINATATAFGSSRSGTLSARAKQQQQHQQQHLSPLAYAQNSASFNGQSFSTAHSRSNSPRLSSGSASGSTNQNDMMNIDSNDFEKTPTSTGAVRTKGRGKNIARSSDKDTMGELADTAGTGANESPSPARDSSPLAQIGDEKPGEGRGKAPTSGRGRGKGSPKTKLKEVIEGNEMEQLGGDANEGANDNNINNSEKVKEAPTGRGRKAKKETETESFNNEQDNQHEYDNSNNNSNDNNNNKQQPRQQKATTRGGKGRRSGSAAANNNNNHAAHSSSSSNSSENDAVRAALGLTLKQHATSKLGLGLGLRLGLGSLGLGFSNEREVSGGGSGNMGMDMSMVMSGSGSDGVNTELDYIVGRKRAERTRVNDNNNNNNNSASMNDNDTTTSGEIAQQAAKRKRIDTDDSATEIVLPSISTLPDNNNNSNNIAISSSDAGGDDNNNSLRAGEKVSDHQPIGSTIDSLLN